MESEISHLPALNSRTYPEIPIQRLHNFPQSFFPICQLQLFLSPPEVPPLPRTGAAQGCLPPPHTHTTETCQEI